jgi:hypothetical protein
MYEKKCIVEYVSHSDEKGYRGRPYKQANPARSALYFQRNRFALSTIFFGSLCHTLTRKSFKKDHFS